MTKHQMSCTYNLQCKNEQVEPIKEPLYANKA